MTAMHLPVQMPMHGAWDYAYVSDAILDSIEEYGRLKNVVTMIRIAR
jgi:hypothetical protein